MRINLSSYWLILLFLKVESPPNRGCAEFQGDFDYCEEKQEQCLLETIETVDCNENMNQCLKRINVGDSNCNIEYESNRRKSKQEHMETTPPPPMKTLNEVLKDLKNPINDVKLNCSNEDDFENQKQLLQNEMDQFSEFSRLKMTTAIVINGLIHNESISRTCKRSLKKFEKDMAGLDSAAFLIIPIPFAHWHCGWAYGDVGRVILRLFASIATPNFAMNFNHACAIQRDCYLSRKDRTKCDETYKNSTQGIVDLLKRNKDGAEEFNEILMELSDWRSEYAYSIANLTGSSYRTYSEDREGALNKFNYHQPMNKTAVVFMELNETGNIKIQLDKLYEDCKSNRVEISSCFNNHMNSHEDLSNCLSNIVSQDQKCMNQIQEAKRALETTNGKQAKSEKWKDYIIDIIIGISGSLVGIFVKYCWKQRKEWIRKIREYRRVSTAEPTSVAESSV